MSHTRYRVVCTDCGEIGADTSDDGLFDTLTAERRAGFHEGAFGHSVSVEVVENAPVWQCPVCLVECVGEQERDDHAAGHPGVSPDSFVRAGP